MNEFLKKEIEELQAIARPDLFPWKDTGEVHLEERILARRFLVVISELLQEKNVNYYKE